MSQKSKTSLIDTVSEALRIHNISLDSNRTIIGVSGGSDSVGLLHILAHITKPSHLVAVYVDHGLRPEETQAEQQEINQQCRRLGILFESVRVNVRQFSSDNKLSIEEGARKLRYRALHGKSKKHRATYVAVGHTSNDQVEEFFLRLIRGTGMKGLSGMQFHRDTVIRPLLYVQKSEIMSFLTERGIKWCIDSTNQDRSFLRNRVRHELLPHLKDNFTQSIEKSVLRSMSILREDEQLLSELTQKAYRECLAIPNLQAKYFSPAGWKPISLDTTALLHEHLAVQRRILELCMNQLGITPTYDHINRLTDFCHHGESGKELHLPAGIRVIREQNSILFFKLPDHQQVRESFCQQAPYEMSIPHPGSYTIASIEKQLVLLETDKNSLNPPPLGELHIDGNKINFPLMLRSFLPGDRFRPCNASGSKKVSRFFNDRKIPKRLRPTWPVLLSEGQIVALAGLEIDHAYKITSSTTNAFIIQLNTT